MTLEESKTKERLATPIQFVKGVGPARATLFERMGVRYVRDLLFLFPRDYEDHTDLRPMDALEEGIPQSVCGEVAEIDLRNTASGRSILGVLLLSGTGALRGVWFNQPFMADKFRHGMKVMFFGKPKYQGLVWEMAHPKVTELEEGETPKPEILPLYPLTEGLQQRHVRRAVREALEDVPLLDEVFPDEYLRKHRLLPLREALPEIHFPTDRTRQEEARRRFVYQEFFILQLALAKRRAARREKRISPELKTTAKIDARIRRLFPFEFTEGQNRVVEEITRDLDSFHPMNRLLQGDVGSGKTAVALYAMLVAAAHGCQSTLMAPTEVLARQHHRTLCDYLKNSRVRCDLLVGGLSEPVRRERLEAIANGASGIVVGTQAVLQESVSFNRLGLVVIDEQHRFGVRQRATLRQSGEEPHCLVMTATPIPRTVTMTLFGDLDVSTLSEPPPGRREVHTYLAGEDQRDRWWEFFGKKLREGRQGYVVVPMVEESQTRDVASVQAAYEELANGPLETFRLGLVHGRMHSEEKEAVMKAFEGGEIQVLVCTSVVEVGINVPNATLMTIENAERFGLAQLHQLRGRISRGTHAGYCAAFADPKNEDARSRLEAFAATTDGFELAEKDFALRGPGEVLGTRQHGLPPFRIANLLLDQGLLLEARGDAQALVLNDPGLALPEHRRLAKMVDIRYGHVLELGDVG